MNTILIYGFAQSTYVQTALLTCSELKLKYQLEGLEFKQRSHRQLHPFLKMPAMKHADVIFFETLAICWYLTALKPASSLVPAGHKSQAQMFCWISVAIDYYYRTLVVASVEGNADISSIEATLQPLNDQLAMSPYIVGPELSLADLFILPMILFAQTQFTDDTYRYLPAVHSWMKAMINRPGYQEIVK
jgi:glutathione S-transferase